MTWLQALLRGVQSRCFSVAAVLFTTLPPFAKMADSQLALTVDERIYKQWFQIADSGACCGRRQGESLSAVGALSTPLRRALTTLQRDSQCRSTCSSPDPCLARVVCASFRPRRANHGRGRCPLFPAQRPAARRPVARYVLPRTSVIRGDCLCVLRLSGSPTAETTWVP